MDFKQVIKSSLCYKVILFFYHLSSSSVIYGTRTKQKEREQKIPAYKHSLVFRLLYGLSNLFDKLYDLLYQQFSNSFIINLISRLMNHIQRTIQDNKYIQSSFLVNACKYIFGPINYEKSIFLLGLYVFIDYIIRNVARLNVLSGIWDELLFIGLVLVWLYKLIRYRNIGKYKFTPLDIPIGLFIFVGIFLVSVNAPNLSIAIEGLRAVVQYMIWYYIVVQLVDCFSSAMKIYWLMTFVGTLIGIHSIYQYVAGVPMPGNWVDSAESVRTRAFSIIGSPNILGALFVLLIPMAIALVLSQKHIVKKVIAAFMVITMLGGLFATLSRGAWLAIAFSLVVFVIYKNVKLLIPFILAGSIVFVMVPSLSNRLTYMFSHEYLYKAAQGGRIYRWTEGIKAWSESKFLGLGLGRYGGAVATNNNLSPFYMDNYYLKTLAEMGIIGLGAFILLMVYLIKWCLIAIIEEQNKRKKDLMMGIFAGALGILAQNAVENVFEVPMMVTYFWLCIGLFMSIKMSDKNPELKEE